MPTTEKISLPKAYGRTTTTEDWAVVRARLADAKQYWLATNRPGGSPHLVPVDGLWVDDVWYYGGSPATAHRRAVAADPHATVHLPDPWLVVVVEGEVRPAEPSPELAQRLADAANEKYAEYGYQNDASTYADALALHPRRVIAWSSFPKDLTRFTFDAG
jgi:Pyridoxamine 5'-phosphate oxidase